MLLGAKLCSWHCPPLSSTGTTWRALFRRRQLIHLARLLMDSFPAWFHWNWHWELWSDRPLIMQTIQHRLSTSSWRNIQSWYLYSRRLDPCLRASASFRTFPHLRYMSGHRELRSTCQNSSSFDYFFLPVPGFRCQREKWVNPAISGIAWFGSTLVPWRSLPAREVGRMKMKMYCWSERVQAKSTGREETGISVVIALGLAEGVA